MKISKAQQVKLNKITKKHKIIFAVIFGSQARGVARPESDLDIAVLAGRKTSYKDFTQLFSAFSDVFRGYNVDLRFLDDASILFRFEVMRYSQLLCGKPIDYHRYRIYAYVSYLDAKDLFNLQDEILQRKHKELIKKVL